MRFCQRQFSTIGIICQWLAPSAAHLAPYLNAAIGIDGAKISTVLFMWGIAAPIGVFASTVAVSHRI
jgi:hypothetical protein